MPVTKAFVEDVTAKLQAAAPVRIRKMFGGLGLYVDEDFFGVCDDDRTYFKVDDATLEAYDRRGMGPWMVAGEVNGNYRQVPPDVMEDPNELGKWIAAACQAARRKKQTKR